MGNLRMKTSANITVEKAKEYATQTLKWINDARQAKIDCRIAQEMAIDRRSLWQTITGKPEIHCSQEEALKIIKGRTDSWALCSDYDDIMVTYGLSESIAKNVLKLANDSADGLVRISADDLDRLTK